MEKDTFIVGDKHGRGVICTVDEFIKIINEYSKVLNLFEKIYIDAEISVLLEIKDKHNISHVFIRDYKTPLKDYWYIRVK